jgi:Holliday junction DNA helicase RuvB
MSTTAELVRARAWDDFVGQDKLKQNLRIAIDSAVQRYAPLDHVLLVAGPGYGKTTLAQIIASELNDPFVGFKMPTSDKTFRYQVTEAGRGVIFLDEAHNAPRQFQEMLLHALEAGEIHTKDGEVYPADTCTFIAATTDPDKLIEPLRDRFPLQPRFCDYTDEEMELIVRGMADRANIDIDEDLVAAFARATGGTPRVATRLVVAARDLVTTGNRLSAQSVLEMAGFDPDGLSEMHLEYLNTLRTLGDESGLRNICSLIRRKPASVEDLERLLIKRGFIRLTPKGRVLTTAGIKKVLGTRTASDPYREIA